MGLADLALTIGRRDGTKASTPVDIITFIEAPWGLNMSLYPAQKVIIKAHYGLELDDTVKFKVARDWRMQEFYDFTEKDYLRYIHEAGRCNIAEVIPGVERREMILSIGRRSGKCILGDTLVLTDQGVIRIDQLGDPDGPEHQPLNIGVAQEGSQTRARSKFFYNGGIKSTFRITTRCGYRLGGTGNHRVKVMGEDGCVQWKHLSEIRMGDQVAIHRGTGLWASEPVDLRPFHNMRGYKSFVFPKVLDERLGLFLGLLAGDGGWKDTQAISFTADDPETRACAEELFESILGNCTFTPDKRTKRTGNLRCSGVGARQFLHDIGWVYDSDRRSKMVPWSIMRSPVSVVCSFLRGLFETDGGIEADGKVVSFNTASERLAREVQTLLLNLGIVSRFKAKWNPKYKRNYYNVIVRGLRSRRVFAERVGFVSRRKMEPLWASLKAASWEGGNTESIPHLRPWVRRLLESVPKANPGKGWKRSHLRTALGNTIKPSSQEQMTYSRLERTFEIAPDLGADQEVLGHLQEVFDLDYFYDPVETVEQGQAPVYDLNIPEGSMFVANGMTNHNTTLSACIAAHETYKLILKGHPQGYYGLTDANVIQIISVATDKDQAGLLYREVHGHFVNTDFFGGYMANATQTFATFQTPRDIERFGSYKENPKARHSIKVTFRSCVGKGLRGAGNIVVILDEVAHFTDAGQSSAEEVYNAVTPSTSTFSQKNPNNKLEPIGPVEGRIVLISSPLGKQGQFYKLFQIGMRGGDAAQNILCIEAPTWEVNPTIPPHEYAKHYRKDPRVFFTEYGGQFTDRTRGWIESSKDLLACVDPLLRPQRRAPPRVPHFMGLDIALVGDYSAASIGHLTPRGDVAVDLMERIHAGEGDFVGMNRLEFDDVADWIYGLSRRFFITEGIFDQWAGIPLEQALAKRGLKQMKSVHHTKMLKSQIFQNFKDMMYDRRLALYDWPIPNDPAHPHCDYIEELLELQAEVQSKYVIIVEAPAIEGKFDDYSDALVRMVWVATNHVGKMVSFGSGRRTHIAGKPKTNAPLVTAKARMKARYGGSHPSRMIVPRNKGGRGGMR